MPQFVCQILAVDGFDVVVICLVDLVGTVTLLRRGVVLVKLDRPVVEFLCVESLRLSDQEYCKVFVEACRKLWCKIEGEDE